MFLLTLTVIVVLLNHAYCVFIIFFVYILQQEKKLQQMALLIFLAKISVQIPILPAGMYVLIALFIFLSKLNSDSGISLTSLTCFLASLCAQIGYCPQFDSLLEYLTAKEHLELYARIKGVADHRINDVCISFLSS